MPASANGGRIGLANWTPDGFTGRMFKAVASHVPHSGGPRRPAGGGVVITRV